MIDLIQDLRFFIGVFFLIVGAILTLNGLISPILTADVNLNLIVGICFVVFGCGALLMALSATRALRK